MRREAFVAGLSVLAGGLLAHQAGLRVNHTPSMPIGIWLARGAPSRPYVDGDVVMACPSLDELQKAYLQPGACRSGMEPVLKPVAAVSGDTVAVRPDGITVNNIPVRSSAPLPHDGHGRLIQAYPVGVYHVAAGQVWLLIPHPDSFDSRYLGPVAVEDVQGLATPIMVWK